MALRKTKHRCGCGELMSLWPNGKILCPVCAAQNCVLFFTATQGGFVLGNYYTYDTAGLVGVTVLGHVKTKLGAGAVIPCDRAAEVIAEAIAQRPQILQSGWAVPVMIDPALGKWVLADPTSLRAYIRAGWPSWWKANAKLRGLE